MKRNFKLLVALLVMTMVLTLASCDIFAEHEHEYSADWSHDETNHWHASICEDGEECSTTTADLAEHTYVDGACSVCGYKEPHTHSYTVVVTEPTCTANGYSTYTCECGDSYKADGTDAKGHNYRYVVTAPTCTEGGYTSFTCLICAYSYVGDEVEATGHNYVDGKCECGVIDADHAHVYEDSKCTICGVACEHAWGAPVIVEDATCTEDGSKVKTCTVCGAEETMVITQYGHDEEIIPRVEPTCTTAGYTEGAQCTVCGEITKVPNTLNPAGHELVEGECTKCDYVDPDYNGAKTYTYVLDVQSMEAVSQGSKADGDTATFADFFTIYYSAKFKLDSSKKTFEDGFAATQRLNWGGTTEINAAIKDENDEVIGHYTKNAIQFVTEGPATVKVWWVSGGDGREVGIFDANGEIVTATSVTSVKNTMYYSELTLAEAGEYYLGTDNTNASGKGGNYTFKVEVNVTVTPSQKNEIKAETTDTYTWVDKVTFTAEGEGNYTFTLPAGLGAWEVNACDNYTAAPYVDYYENAEGASFTVGLEAGETLEFYIAALTKDTWFIEWTYEACDVEDKEEPGQGGETSSTLVVGVNTIAVPAGAFMQSAFFTFTVENAGTYTFASNDLLAIITLADGTQVRGQATLEPGTYTVEIVYYAFMAGDYTINVEYSDPNVGEEEDGSYNNPYTITVPGDIVVAYPGSGMIYYIFTPEVSGFLTLSFEIADTWVMCDDVATADRVFGGYEQFSYTGMVEAGVTYILGIGTWSEDGVAQDIAVSVTIATDCTHSYDIPWYHPEMVDATCTTPGVIVYECIYCGDYYTEATEINPDVHNLDYSNPTIITPANCATGESGLQSLVCLDCGETVEEELYAYHDLEETYVYATCTEDGSYYAICTVCGYEESYVNEAYGHSNWYLTCGETGECMECGETFTVEHNTVWTPATCTEAAFCMNCFSYVGEPLGHSYEAVVTAPTCGEDGYTTYTCTTCYESYVDDIVPAYGHTIVSAVILERASCAAPAKFVITCGECEQQFHYGEDAAVDAYLAIHTYWLPILAQLPHDLESRYVTTLPTCTEKGYNTYTCMGCGAQEKRDWVDALGHTEGEVVVENYVDSHCYVEGSYDDVVYCTVCDAELSRVNQVIEKKAHTHSEVLVENYVDNTCTTNGGYDNVVYCTVEECKAELSREFVFLAAFGHTTVVDAAVAPTCTETGLTEGSHCDVCGEVFVAQDVIDALGHSDITHDGKCETCNKYFRPEVGEAFVLKLVPSNGKTYYFTGNMVNSYYFGTSEKYTDAVTMYIEEATGGFNMYFYNASGAKQYIYVIASGTYNNVKFGASNAGNVWNFNETYGSFETKTTNGTVYIGTYSTYTTISASYVSYYSSSSNYAAHAIVTPEHDECVDSNLDFICDYCPTAVAPADGTTLTVEQALALGKMYASGSYTTNKYYITGIVDSVDNATYGNIYIKDENGNKLYVYGIYSADGETRFDAMDTQPIVGDKVTLYTVIGYYSSSVQAKNAWMDDLVQHDHNPVMGATVAATCTEDGYTPYTCANCNVTEKKDVVKALGHTVEEGTCDRCGTEIVNGVKNATLSFASTAQRTQYSTTIQVWEQNGVKLTNNKGSSTSNVGNYYNPARFYASSNIVIEAKGMTKLVFTCGSSSYATALKNSIGTQSGVTVSVSSSTVTVTFAEAIDSFTIAKLTAQVRVSKLVVNP